MVTTIKAVKVENGVRMMLNSRDGKFLAQTRVRIESLKWLEMGRLDTVFFNRYGRQYQTIFPKQPSFFRSPSLEKTHNGVISPFLTT